MMGKSDTEKIIKFLRCQIGSHQLPIYDPLKIIISHRC